MPTIKRLRANTVKRLSFVCRGCWALPWWLGLYLDGSVRVTVPALMASTPFSLLKRSCTWADWVRREAVSTCILNASKLCWIIILICGFAGSKAIWFIFVRCLQGATIAPIRNRRGWTRYGVRCVLHAGFALSPQTYAPMGRGISSSRQRNQGCLSLD